MFAVWFVVLIVSISYMKDFVYFYKEGKRSKVGLICNSLCIGIILCISVLYLYENGLAIAVG